MQLLDSRIRLRETSVLRDVKNKTEMGLTDYTEDDDVPVEAVLKGLSEVRNPCKVFVWTM